MKPKMDTDGHRSKLTDSDRRKFLNALDRAPFEVTDAEAQFIGSTFHQMNFTRAQRAAIDRMIETYGERIGF